jgi:hypothetical protein
VSKSEGLRYDADKLRMDLIPPEAELFLARVLTQGAQKYASRNWELGMDWSRCIGALKRHLLRWELGQMYDQESGEPHLAHVLWNAMALLVYEQRDIGKDDRPECAIPYDAIDDYFKVESKPPREETLRDLGYEDLPEASKASLDTLGVGAGAVQVEEPASPVEVEASPVASPVTTTAPCPCRACNPSYLKTNHK